MDDNKNITENEEYEKTGQEDESESKKPKKAKKKQDKIDAKFRKDMEKRGLK